MTVLLPATQVVGAYQHAQLNGQHSHSGLLLGFLLSLPQCLGSSGMAHVSQADPGDVEPLSLDAHASHVLPDSLAVRNGRAVSVSQPELGY